MAFVVTPSFNASCTTRREDINLLNPCFELKIEKTFGNRLSCRAPIPRKPLVAMASNSVQSVALVPTVDPRSVGTSIMVNGCTGKVGRAVLEAAIAAGLKPVPVALGGPEDVGKILDFNGKQIEIHGPSDRESVLSSAFKEYPDLIVVDYTVPAAVNGIH